MTTTPGTSSRDRVSSIADAAPVPTGPDELVTYPEYRPRQTTTTTAPAPPPPTTAAPKPAPAPAPPKPKATPAPSSSTAPVASAESFRQCVFLRESSRNYHVGYGGGYGILPSTWRSLGYSGVAGDASPALQDQAFWQLYNKLGVQPWRPYDGC